MLRTFLIVLLFLSFNSCSAEHSKKASAEKANAQKAEAPEGDKSNSDAKAKAPHKEEDQIKKGDKLKDALSSFMVTDLNGKTASMDSILPNSNTIIAFVKPGCVFCESFETATEGKDFKAPIHFIVDAAHVPSEEEFKAFAKKHSKVPGRFFYDKTNYLAGAFDIHSFPTFIVTDAKRKTLFFKKGLVMVDRPESLQEVPFNIAVTMLANKSVDFLKTF